MNISTTRFGDITIDESRIISMRGGILGFEHIKRYVLLTQNENIPFMWFQAVDDGSLAFVVVSPFLFKAGYEPTISDYVVETLEIDSPDDAAVMAIVTIRHKPFSVSANLMAPVIINGKKMLARQVVLQDQNYPIQYALTELETAVGGQEFEAKKMDRNLKTISSPLVP